MKAVGLFIQNICKISLAAIEFTKDGIAQINGKNESGKSTVLKCIVAVLSGKSGIPDDMVQRGKKEGLIKFTIGSEYGKPEYVATLKIDKNGKSKLHVGRSDKTKLPVSQQALLNTFWNDVSLDPIKFVEANDDERREMVMKCSKFAIIRDEWNEIVGEGYNANDPDPLAILDVCESNSYNTRATYNANVKRLTTELAALAHIPDGLEPVDISELMKKRREMESLKQQKADIVYEISHVSERMAGNTVEITRLKEQIDQLELQNTNYTSRKIYLEDENDKIPEQDFTEIDSKISNANLAKDSANKQKLSEELESEEFLAKFYDERVEAIREYRKKVGESAALPHPSLSFNDDGKLMFEDDLLDARGKSRQVILGAAVAKALQPKLDLILIRDGNDIGNEYMEELSIWARDNGMLLLVEREINNNPDGVGFTIDEDGEVS